MDITNVTDQLGGSRSTIFHNAPGWVITACASIVLGYIVQISGKIKRRDKISLAIIPFSIVVNEILTWHLREGSVARWIVQQGVAGMIIGFVAWIFHVTILKKLEEKFPFLKGALKESGLEKENGKDNGSIPK